MNIRKGFAALLLGTLPVLTGCYKTTRVVQLTAPPSVTRYATADELISQLNARFDAIQSLNTSVLVAASTGGGRQGKVTDYTSLRGYIFMRKPRDLRVLLQVPVIGSSAVDIDGDGKQFKMWIPSKNKAIVGTDDLVTKPSENPLENLRPGVFFDSMLIGRVEKDQFVTLTEDTRILESQTKHREAVAEPDYDLTVLNDKGGNVLQPVRVVHISRVTLLPYQQDIYDDMGRVTTRATYDNYQTYGEIQFPSLIMINRPLDELSLKVTITKLTPNQKMEDDQFEVTIPMGATVQTMN
jgi:outer membrane lipoprotein-sorting protein